MSILIPISIFIFTVLSVVVIYFLFARNDSVAAERLKDMGRQSGSTEGLSSTSMFSVLTEKVTETFKRMPPPSPKDAAKLQKKLIYAGYINPAAPVIYRGIAFVSLAIFPLLITMYLVSRGYSLMSNLTWVIGGLGAGYLLPRVILDNKIKRRQLRLQWGLADALDLMVVSIEAGLALNSAMVRVSEELREVHPEISKEFELVNLEIMVGQERESSLRNLAERSGVEDLRGLCAILIQADRFGASIAKAVRVYSDSLRTKRRQRAEQEAQKAAVKLLFPLAVFLFPTLFIAILGPAALQLMDNFAKR